MNDQKDIRLGDFFLVPNLISISRLLLTPLIGYFLWLGTERGTLLAVILLIVAALTDYFDGLAARLMKRTTALGLVLDPLADKIFALILIVELVFLREFPLWLALVIILRDLLILSGALRMVKYNKIIPFSIISGKYYFASLAVLILSHVIRFPFGIELFLYIAVILLVVSSIEYTALFIKSIGGGIPERKATRPIGSIIRTTVAVIIGAIYLYKLYAFLFPGSF